MMIDDGREEGVARFVKVDALLLVDVGHDGRCACVRSWRSLFL